LAWICPLLMLHVFTEDEYIYNEGDGINSVFFLEKGSCGFVLPRYSNLKYINIPRGSEFGSVDLVSNMLQNDFHLLGDEWILHKERYKRNFTLMADCQSDVFLLTLEDLNRMKTEFFDMYELFF